MKNLYFVFCLHNHQPVGNFDQVVEDAYRRSYLPFLEALWAHPSVTFVMHVSGCLWEWIERVHPEYVDRVRAAVGRGQLEILTGGFYEPILAMIPDEDKLSQIGRYSEHLRNRLGVDPKGMWLAERVWEPQLARWLGEAGVRYTALDDFHFRASGIRRDALVSHFTTEDQGRSIQVFPMSETLRYLIPFGSVEETEQYLRSRAEAFPGSLVVFGDDGEKFGVWPGTHRTVYERGWLESFLAMLEKNAEWLHTVTFSEWLDRSEPAGHAYLPTLSYPEMMEWALPADCWKEFRENRAILKGPSHNERNPRFLRGGYWRSFLSKYPESYRMYSRMLDVRRRLAEADSGGRRSELEPAWLDLWRAQCNCAYWHGIFGGLYLKHLRSEIYRRLISAECVLEDVLHGKGDWIDRRMGDVDGDGTSEIVLSTPEVNVLVSPRRGGSVFELDFKPARANLLATLARRPEGYHADLVRVSRKPGTEDGEQTQSIHDRVAVKETGLDSLLVYDDGPRDSWTCHFLPASVTAADLKENRYEELGDFADLPFDLQDLERVPSEEIVLRREGRVNTPAGPRRVDMTKTLRVVRPGELALTVDLAAPNESVDGVCFGTVFNIALSDGANPECFYVLNGAGRNGDLLGAEADDDGIDSVALVDGYVPVRVDLSVDRNARLLRFPIATVSQSEDGFEKSYQSSVVVLLWKVDLPPGEHWRVRVGVQVSTPEAVVESPAGRL